MSAALTEALVRAYYEPLGWDVDDLDPDDLRDCKAAMKPVAALVLAHEAAARIEGLAVAEVLLRKVVNYWEGRPTTHHGDHIYADLRDVLRAITPVSEGATP